MWQLLLTFLGGPVISGLINAYKAKLDAANTTGAQAVEVAKAALVAETTARAETDKLITVQMGHWWSAWPMILVQASGAAFFAKCVVWDTMLGWGETPKLGGDVATTYNLVMSFWFGGVAVKGAIAAVRTWWR